jgi:pSer/pThr/pTyr-binding forkhead associated (FHA) protein
MVQLKIISGRMAGGEKVVRHFPFRIGRSAHANLQVEEDGVWEEHAQVEFDPAEGFVLRLHEGALASVNGEPCREAVLRNGDEIAIGALKLRFWLAASRQFWLGPREWLTWGGIALVTAAELLLIYRLIPQ